MAHADVAVVLSKASTVQVGGNEDLVWYRHTPLLRSQGAVLIRRRLRDTWDRAWHPQLKSLNESCQVLGRMQMIAIKNH